MTVTSPKPTPPRAPPPRDARRRPRPGAPPPQQPMAYADRAERERVAEEQRRWEEAGEVKERNGFDRHKPGEPRGARRQHRGSCERGLRRADHALRRLLRIEVSHHLCGRRLELEQEHLPLRCKA